MIPKYVDCKNKNFQVCEYYSHKDCPETCNYAKDIKGMGVGSIMEVGVIGNLEKKVGNEIKNRI